MPERTQPGLGVGEILGVKRTAVLQLIEQYGGSNARVFGSVARGEAGPDSDVDLLISFPPDRSIFDLVGLWLDLKDLVGRDVSLITDEIEDKQFLDRILKDAQTL